MRAEFADAFAACAEVGQVEPALAFALADELVLLTGQLSELAYDLGSDPDTLRRHMASLQAVDAVTQGVLVIADLLRSSAPLPERLATVSLAAMADRLKRITLSDAQGG